LGQKAKFAYNCVSVSDKEVLLQIIKKEDCHNLTSRIKQIKTAAKNAKKTSDDEETRDTKAAEDYEAKSTQREALKVVLRPVFEQRKAIFRNAIVGNASAERLRQVVQEADPAKPGAFLLMDAASDVDEFQVIQLAGVGELSPDDEEFLLRLKEKGGGLSLGYVPCIKNLRMACKFCLFGLLRFRNIRCHCHHLCCATFILNDQPSLAHLAS
jgi:hypothetical protein